MNTYELQKSDAYRRAFTLANLLDADSDANEQATVLQPIDKPRSEHPRDLYYRVVSGTVIESDEGHLSIAACSTVSFDTYFSSFYECLWTKHSEIPEYGVSLMGEGEAFVRVFRLHSNGVVTPVASRRLRFDASGCCSVYFAAANPANLSGRIFFEIETAERDVTIKNINYVTRATPVRQVRVGLGLCTFNREPYLRETVQTLLRSPSYRRGAASLFIVNQGDAFRTDFMKTVQDGAIDNAKVFNQSNLGGAGGFARAYHEISDDGDCTHVLLMDDDIVFSTAALETSIAFASYSKLAVPIGGHMLDLNRPWMIYETGGKYVEFDWLMPLQHQLDARRGETLENLSAQQGVDYIGWWFFMAPIELMKTAGYPLPLFIKMDDVEYGVRLFQNFKRQTVSLSPVAVWHEPFYAKMPNWQIFYFFRNHLIVSAIQADDTALPRVSVIKKRIRNALLRLNYMEAAMMILALEEFCKGPSRLARDGKEIHKATLAMHKKYALKSVPEPTVARMMAPKSRPSSRISRFITTRLSTFLKRLGWARKREYAAVGIGQDSIWTVGRLPSYVLGEFGQKSYFMKMEFDSATHRELAGRAKAIIADYARRRAELITEWRSAVETLTSRESWEKIFAS